MVAILVKPRTVWWLEYWFNPGLCGGCTGLAQDCVGVGVQVEPVL